MIETNYINNKDKSLWLLMANRLKLVNLKLVK